MRVCTRLRGMRVIVYRPCFRLGFCLSSACFPHQLQGEVDEKGRYVAVLESKLLRLTTRLVAQERLRRQRQQQHAQQQSLPHQAQQGRQPSEARSHSRSPQCASDTVTPSSAPTPSPIASSSGHAPPAARPPAIAMPATATHEAWDAGGDTVDMLDLDELLRAAYRTLGGSGGLKATAGTPAAGGEDGDITPRDSAGGAPESGGEGNGVELGKEGGSGMADQRKPSTEVSPRAPRRSCPLSMHADVGGSNGAAVAALSVETNAAVAPAATASSSGGTASHDADVLTGAGRLARPGSLRAMPQPRLAWLDPADTATSPRSRSAAVAGGGGEGGAHGSGSRGVAGSSAHVVWADAAVERMVLAVGTNRALSSSVADNSEGDADEGEEAGELVECSDGGGDGEDGAVGHAVSVLRAARDGFGAEHRTTARGTAGDSSGATLSPAGPVPTRDRGSPPLGPPACNNMLVPPSPQHAPTLKSTRDSTGPPPTSLLAPTPSPQHPTVVRSPARAQCSPVTDPCGGTTAPSAPVRPAMLRPTPPSPVLPAGQAPSAAGAARPQLLSPAHSSASPTNTSQSSQGGAPTPLRSVRRHGDLFNVGHAIPPLAIAKFSARSAFPGTDNPGVRGSGQSRLNVAEDHTLALGLSRDGAAATTSAEGGAVHAETTSSAMPALPDSDRGIRADAGPQARSDASSIEPGRAACPAAGVGLLEVAALAEALPPIRPPPAAAIHAPAAPSTGSPSPPKPDPPRGHDSSLAPPAVSHTSKVSPPLLAQQQQQPATTSPSSPAHGSLGCLSPPDIPAATAAVHASLSQASAPPPQPSPGSPRLRCPVAVAPASNRDLPAALAAPSGAMTLNPHGTRRAPPRAPGPGAVRAAPVEHPSCTADGHRKVQPCGSITRPSGRGSPPGRRPPPGGDIRGPGQARLLSNETPASSASASLPPHEPPSESSSIAPTPRASAPPMPAPPSPTPPQLLASSLLTGSLASPGASSLGGSSSSALDTTAAASDSRASALASSLVTAPLLDLPASLLLADSAHAPDDPSATLSRQAAETKRGASGAAADSSTRGSRGAQERAVTDAGRAAVDAGALGLADLAVATTVAQPEKSPRRIMQQLAPRGENGLPGHGSMSSSALTAATEGPPLAASGLVASNEGAPGNCGRGMTGPEVSDADLEQSDALSLCLSEIKGLLDKRPHSLTKAAHTGLALRRFHGRVELFAGCSRVTGRFFCFVCLVMSWLTFFRLPGESGQMPLSFMAFFTHL